MEQQPAVSTLQLQGNVDPLVTILSPLMKEGHLHRKSLSLSISLLQGC